MKPRVISKLDDEWPLRLAHLQKLEPDQLWMLGSGQISQRAVAIVGSRNATASGMQIAFELAKTLAAQDVQVISGLARGIDAAAHRGAIAGAGSTIGVLGCGIDVVYPPEHEELRDDIEEQGLLVTEYAPKTEPFKGNFPQRNRIIAALALAVIVVEATERSGALSTARWALDLGRDLYAVPGSILDARSRGTNLLIRDGAIPLLETSDLSATFANLPKDVPGSKGEIPADPLLALMGTHPVHADWLAAQLGIPPQALAAQLVQLEMDGRVQRVGGSSFRSTVPR